MIDKEAISWSFDVAIPRERAIKGIPKPVYKDTQA
jgi:hypothetical protein